MPSSRTFTQLILVFFAIIAVFLLFTFGQTKTPLEEALAKMRQGSKEQESTVVSLDYAPIIAEKLKNLPKSDRDSLSLPSNFWDNDLEIHQFSSQIWERNREIGPSAYHKEQYAIAVGDEPAWTEAGYKYFVASRLEQDSLLQAWYAQQAVASYEKASEIAPTASAPKIGLAKTYIDGSNEVMQGVFLLREVVETDSLNIEANTIMGRLAVFSRQFDKAVKRLNTVLQQEPKNTEALYYMGEAYLGLGNKEKALVYLEECRSLVDNPAFRKELDQYIQKVTE